ncbi:restriction endonuclease subunit S [[Ruminococcus] torques]|uniref:restriction endonuclease subunit S n=3 Tax=Bacillota TaxID=1239 RepID=UPI001D0848D2|nr:restriction endonuclease subunit S [[Ruminococcus] torques]MCB7250500.1 restriction endonuclease subunit S [[Ruminococcus] torques]MCG5029038.1 restriction endonuclease subunit S [[Ruminococcus] torques]MCQ5361258.1 restriction endonuclease subunit S [[Ruminococcus] torques]
MKYEKVKIAEVCELINGIAFKSKDFQDNGIPVIKIANVKANKMLLDNLKCVSVELANSKSKGRIKNGDILLTLTGNRKEGGPDSWVGKAAIFRENGHYMLNQRLCIVRPKNETIDNEYLAYNLSSWNAQLYFINHATSSGGQANISPAIINNYEIPLPDINTQKKISHILSRIDLQIRINERINNNLLQHAQVLYQKVFITDADTSWAVGHLSDLVTIKYGKDHKKLEDGSFPVYGSGGIMRYVERPLYDKESVLVPRKGTLNNVMYVNEPFWSVDTMFYTEMQQPNIAKFVFHYLKGKDLASMNAGSAVPSMTTAILNAMKLRIPDADTLKRFEELVSPMYVAIADNNAQSAKLAELRDTLLPKLMSGEIDVSTIEL